MAVFMMSVVKRALLFLVVFCVLSTEFITGSPIVKRDLQPGQLDWNVRSEAIRFWRENECVFPPSELYSSFTDKIRVCDLQYSPQSLISDVCRAFYEVTKPICHAGIPLVEQKMDEMDRRPISDLCHDIRNIIQDSKWGELFTYSTVSILRDADNLNCERLCGIGQQLHGVCSALAFTVAARSGKLESTGILPPPPPVVPQMSSETQQAFPTQQQYNDDAPLPVYGDDILKTPEEHDDGLPVSDENGFQSGMTQSGEQGFQSNAVGGDSQSTYGEQTGAQTPYIPLEQGYQQAHEVVSPVSTGDQQVPPASGESAYGQPPSQTGYGGEQTAYGQPAQTGYGDDVKSPQADYDQEDQTEYGQQPVQPEGVQTEYGQQLPQPESVQTEYGQQPVQPEGVQTEYGQQLPQPESVQTEYGQPAQSEVILNEPVYGEGVQNEYGQPAQPEGVQNAYGQQPAYGEAVQTGYGQPAQPEGVQNEYGQPAQPEGVQNEYGQPAQPEGIQNEYGQPAQPEGVQNEYGQSAQPEGIQNEYGQQLVQTEYGQQTGLSEEVKTGYQQPGQTSYGEGVQNEYIQQAAKEDGTSDTTYGQASQPNVETGLQQQNLFGQIPEESGTQQVVPQSGEQQAYPQSGEQQAYPQSGEQQAYPQSEEQQVYPQSGEQQVYPQSGEQQVYPQSGEQQVYPQSGEQQAYPQSGEQQVYPQSGEQQVYPQSGEQQVYPQSGEQQVYPQSGEQQVYPQSGEQQVYPQSGEQQVYPQSGEQQQQGLQPQVPNTAMQFPGGDGAGTIAPENQQFTQPFTTGEGSLVGDNAIDSEDSEASESDASESDFDSSESAGDSFIEELEKEFENEDSGKSSKQSNFHTYIAEEESTNHHFLAYSLTAIILVMGAYVLYHNKQKIVAIVIEGRHRHGRRRGGEEDGYKKLEQSVSEAMPTLQATKTSKEYVF